MDLWIVTGASKGLGKALVENILQASHHCIAMARTPIEPRPGLEVIKCDFAAPESIPALLRPTLQRHSLAKYGAIHLVNNAGDIEPIGPARGLSTSAIKKSIEINLTAPMVLTSTFLELTAGFGGYRTVTNVSSGVAQNPKATWSIYSAAKAGLRIYSHALAQEFLPEDKVKVVSFGPGIMDTKMQETIRAQPEDQFPDVERFKSFKRDGKLLDPVAVAGALAELLAAPEKINRIDIPVQELL